MRFSLPEKATFLVYLQRALTWFFFSTSIFLVLCLILDGFFGIVYYWLHNIVTYRNGNILLPIICFFAWSGLLYFYRKKVLFWWVSFGVGMYLIFMLSFCQLITIIGNFYDHQASVTFKGRMYHISHERNSYAEGSLDVYECDPWGMFCRLRVNLPFANMTNPYGRHLVHIRVEPEQNMIYIEVDGEEIYSFQP